MADAPAEKIPTIDIGSWLSADSSEADKQRTVDEVHHAATTYGFFQAVGHGVTWETRQQMLDLTKRFFSLPIELPDTKEVRGLPPYIHTPSFRVPRLVEMNDSAPSNDALSQAR